MARPTKKSELLDAATYEFERLWEVVGRIAEGDRERAGACETWSVKDLLAHLDAWHEMYLGWEASGSAGESPKMPADGYSWGDTPALNEKIYEQARDDSWDAIERRVRASHCRVLEVIDGYSDDDLFTKKRFAWTGSTSVGSYTVSASSSHYAWASKLLRRWVKVLDAS